MEHGATQASLNNAIHDFLLTTGSDGAFRQTFMKKVEGEYKINSIKVNSWLGRLTDARGLDGDEALKDFLNTSQKLADHVQDANSTKDFLNQIRVPMQEAEEQNILRIKKYKRDERIKKSL